MHFVIKLATAALHLAIKALAFAVPVAFVANWLDVEATWKTVTFVMFCIFWYGCLDDRSSSQPAEPLPAPAKPRVPVVPLTPAQVAAEAHKLTPRPPRPV